MTTAREGSAPSLSIRVSPDLDAYAAGQIPATAIRCVLCRTAPCGCPEFGSPAYLALLDQAHGRKPA